MNHLRRKTGKSFPITIVVIILLGFLIWSISYLFNQSAPRDIVEEFYISEQEGDFGSAWDLFHPVMKERFTKNAFVTERSHIYMGHYGVSSFSFKVLDSKKMKKRKMAKEGPEFQNPHRITVEQTIKSKFGTFTIKQYIYVVKDKEEWKIIWEYK